jgi:CheY-like chemotaxis protein/two-component sensor histidine kinase
LHVAEEARHTAEAANRMKDEFLAVVSHELRTPLNAILGWAKLLRSGRLNDAQATQAIQVIERNSHVQAKLIEDLLDVSRIISGTLKLDVQRLDMVNVVEQVLSTLAPALEAKGVELRKLYKSERMELMGDSARLQQVVWNLVSNAVKFTPKGGRVELTLEDGDESIRVIVRDTGEGIASEFLPYVFDRFRQADASSTRGHGGLGLGLAIVRQLVELHGGSVNAVSEGLGQGCTFTVTLPRVSARQAAALPVAAPRLDEPSGLHIELPALQGIRVLAVDDEPANLHMLATALREFGAEVRVADAADTGLHTFVEWKPDVIVSDVGMPVEDGYSLLARIRNLEQDTDHATPAVALTAFARPEDRHRALAAGFQMHVSKPIDPFEIGALIADLKRRDKHTKRSTH